jgi:hypothetical protein
MQPQDSFSIEKSNFEASIFIAPGGLHMKCAARIERTDWAQKKICWMKKIRCEMARRARKSARIARITRIIC